MTDPETVHPYERLSSGTRTSVPSFIQLVNKSITFSFVIPLLAKGAARDLDKYSAMEVNPVNETIEELEEQFVRIWIHGVSLVLQSFGKYYAKCIWMTQFKVLVESMRQLLKVAIT